MASHHPIYDHLRRDAQGRSPRPRTSETDPDALIPPVQGPLYAGPGSPNPNQTPPPIEPIPQQPGLLIRLLRKLKLSRSPKSPVDDAAPRSVARPIAAPKPGTANRAIERLVAAAQRRWLKDEIALRPSGRAGQSTDGKFVDTLTATPGEPDQPDEAFARLRWGGVFLYVDTDERRAQQLADAYDAKRGFILETPPTQIHALTCGMRLPGISPQGVAFLARKVQLIQPGDYTERFTYSVELTPVPKGPDAPDGYVVTKRVPTHADLLDRLRHKFPDVPVEDLHKRAHKLVDHVFPTFLTREAAMLGILQTNLDPAFRDRVPKPLGIQKDSRGFVRTLHMNWKRIGGEPISQLDFAIQSAELLTALHEQARVMHLDLRMDNMVITPEGVGFVDFGSACRIGEHVEKSPMLGTLFTEMMRTSQIQRMLGKMIERGHVTNNAIAEVYGKTDKTVDAFYLAVQIAKPHANPDLKQLIDYDKDSDVAGMLSALTAAVLRPKNPEMAQYKSAGDLVRGLKRIERRAAKAAAKRG